MKYIDFADREFVFLFYQTSHSEAIIRSFKRDIIQDKNHDKNIDIYIGAIEYIELPCRFQGFRISKPTEEEQIYLCRKLRTDIPIEKIIVLVSGEERYYVVASVLSVLENDLDFLELPIYNFLRNKNLN